MLRNPQPASTRRRNTRRGSTIVETALVLVAFVTMLIGIADCSQFLFLHQCLTERLRAALRYGVVNPYDPTAIRNMVLYGSPTAPDNATPIWHLTPEMVSVTRYDQNAAGDRLVITISNFQFQFFTPIVSKVVNGIPITGTMSWENGGQ